MQGMKLVKIVELPLWWDHQKKQRKKVSLRELLERVANDGAGATVVNQGAGPPGRVNRVESVELLPTRHTLGAS